MAKPEPRTMTPDERQDFEAHKIHHEDRDQAGPASESEKQEKEGPGAPVPPPNPD